MWEGPTRGEGLEDLLGLELTPECVGVDPPLGLLRIGSDLNLAYFTLTFPSFLLMTVEHPLSYKGCILC